MKGFLCPFKSHVISLAPKIILVFTGLRTAQQQFDRFKPGHLLLGRSHESQSVEYLQFLPQTVITVGKYRAMTVDKYEYCRGVQDCPGELIAR